MVGHPPPAAEPAGVYLHFPFCAIRCTYCDFATVAGKDDLIESYLDALCHEIGTFQRGLPDTADTVFLGGGTPSRMTPQQLGRVLDAVRDRFALAPAAEITVECNPESVAAEKLAGYVEAGVTRASIGVQSLNDEVLRRVGRAHDGACAAEAVGEALAMPGLEVSVDLIAGLPGENPGEWESTLRRVSDWGTAHLSVYLLETDKETPLAHSIRSGRTPKPDEDEQARLFECTERVLGDCGFEGYEISNFARRGRRSRHNVKYWTDAWYAGFGLGAHGYAAGARRANTRSLQAYLERLGGGHDPGEEIDPWDPVRRIEESLILGLRMATGPDVASLSRRYELDLSSAFAEPWAASEKAGLLERSAAGRPRLTRRGRLFSNQVFVELLDRLKPADMS